MGSDFIFSLEGMWHKEHTASWPRTTKAAKRKREWVRDRVEQGMRWQGQPGKRQQKGGNRFCGGWPLTSSWCTKTQDFIAHHTNPLAPRILVHNTNYNTEFLGHRERGRGRKVYSVHPKTHSLIRSTGHLSQVSMLYHTTDVFPGPRTPTTTPDPDIFPSF